ncbi:lysozyme inhibitor LprI family protein [Sphingomonas sp. CJ20]
MTTKRIGMVSALVLGIAAAAPALAAERDDPTEVALRRCLEAPANVSTAAQVDCEAAAMRSYDRRMNAAYTALMRTLPAPAAARLKAAQRAWLAYRDAEVAARRGVYATQQGTMFVPMAADAAAAIVGDRARMLERYLRITRID